MSGSKFPFSTTSKDDSLVYFLYKLPQLIKYEQDDSSFYLSIDGIKMINQIDNIFVNNILLDSIVRTDNIQYEQDKSCKIEYYKKFIPDFFSRFNDYCKTTDKAKKACEKTAKQILKFIFILVADKYDIYLDENESEILDKTQLDIKSYIYSFEKNNDIKDLFISEKVILPRYYNKKYNRLESQTLFGFLISKQKIGKLISLFCNYMNSYSENAKYFHDMKLQIDEFFSNVQSGYTPIKMTLTMIKTMIEVKELST